MHRHFNGPLRRCSKNPRYFTDESGEAIYLTGSHTWSVFQDAVAEDGRLIAFDYNAYLDFMERHNHNFLRLWCRESAFGSGFGGKTTPMPYEQVGVHANGIPKFDLTKLNEAYFERLRERVRRAGERGIYTGVMLFEGWSVDSRGGTPWTSHPYNADNNINGIDGNPGRRMQTALSGENDSNPFMPDEHILVHTLEDPKITALQKAYVRRVVETLNDCDNVLYEICNEALRWSRYWQYEMIDFIKETERSLPKQHPVWMSHLVPAQNESLLVSHADAVSFGEESTAGDYCIDPPAGDGARVVLSDTDHLGGIWGTAQWAWKSFMRGLNPIFMDIYDRGGDLEDLESTDGARTLFGRVQYALPEDWAEPVRVALGRTRKMAQKIDLTNMTPHGELASTKYCLANPGEEYLIFQPESGQFKVLLYGATGPFQVEWYIPETDETLQGEPFTGGTAIDFTPPVSGQILLYLHK